MVNSNKFERFSIRLDSVLVTRRDMSDQYTIANKLRSSRLWILSTKEFLPGLLKKMWDAYKKSENRKIFIPVKVTQNAKIFSGYTKF